MVLFFGSAAAAPGDLDPTFGRAGEAKSPWARWLSPKGLRCSPTAGSFSRAPARADSTLARFNSDGTLTVHLERTGKWSASGRRGLCRRPPARRQDPRRRRAGRRPDGRRAVHRRRPPRFDVRKRRDRDRPHRHGARGRAGAGRQDRGRRQQSGSRHIGAGQRRAPSLRPRGTPDAGFGSNGVVRTRVGASSDAWALALQADGKILAAGSGGDFSSSRRRSSATSGRAARRDLRERRHRTGDALDPATAIGVMSDGRIVVAGTADLRLAVMRLEPTGARPDIRLKRSGDDRNGGLSGAWDLALQPDGGS